MKVLSVDHQSFEESVWEVSLKFFFWNREYFEQRYYVTIKIYSSLMLIKFFWLFYKLFSVSLCFV